MKSVFYDDVENDPEKQNNQIQYKKSQNNYCEYDYDNHNSTKPQHFCPKLTVLSRMKG